MNKIQYSPQAQAFIDYVYSELVDVIHSWSDETPSDIYVVWIRLSLYRDDCRFVEISALRYGSNAHTTLDLERSYQSKWSPGCWANGTDLCLCHDSDTLGQELREAYLKADVTRFDRSDVEYHQLFEHLRLQQKHNHNAKELSTAQEARLEELNQCFRITETERQALQEQSQYLQLLYQDTLLTPILNACTAVIQRLHFEGVLERKYGHAVPIGIYFSNDINPNVALRATRDANPHDLARGLEEWMMGCTYAQISAGQELLIEIASKTPREQAAFWAEASLANAERLYVNTHTLLSERLHALGSQKSVARPSENCAAEAAADFVSLLIPQIEVRASAGPITIYSPEDDSSYRNTDNVVMNLLSDLESVGMMPRFREAVRESDVDRLYHLLKRLFRESESLGSVTMITTLVARALHVLRPDRFPSVKFGGGGDTANRLLNYRAFGLTKIDLNTPDYDEEAEEARLTARRLARQQKYL